MDDNRIIDLYFTRDERAIEHTRAKYDKLLYHVSYKILHSNPDAEECVDDTYMKAWGTMPPERPNILSAFLCKITRNLSLNRYMQNKSRSRIMTTEKVFEEIAECVPDTAGPISDDLALRDAINGFLESMTIVSRKIFVKRYFYMMTVKQISVDMATSVSNVKVSLMRSREKFKAYLEKAGISI
jgi:RNA polymerase sigma-70 factor (ECF subfamily)